MSLLEKVEILLVSERDGNLKAWRTVLGDENYIFQIARSGKEALQSLRSGIDPAIMIVDAANSQMAGVENTQYILENSKNGKAPILFLSDEKATPQQILEGYRAGAVDFLQEPLAPEILRAKVAVFAELFKKNRELGRRGEELRVLNARLTQQSQYVRSLIEASIDPLITINSEGKITDMNLALTKITGLSREKITGTDFFDYFTKPQTAKHVYEEIFEKGSIADYLLTIRHKNGKLTDVLLNGSVYKDLRGKVLGVVVVAREKLLSKYSRSLIEASLDPLITINSEGKITDMNQALSNITGITREKIKGTDFFEYFTEPQKAREIYEAVFAKGFVVDFPLTIRHKEGKLTDVLFNGSVYKDERGNVLGVVIVARDITARKKFENELIEAKRNAEKAKQTAEEAVKAKQQFLSNMSHEIRTPLNAIIGFTKVVSKTNLDEKQREYVNAIKISGDALIVLINDILDLAKVEAGKMKFEQIPFKLSASIYAMLHLFETKIEEKNLQLIKSYDEGIPDVIVGDPVRLHQIILNLVSNAVKFTNSGTITVSVKRVDENDKKVKLKFAVSDTGIGIAADKIESIFDNFQQATTDTARVYGGTGLGLAIVKQLVTLQGGEIEVESKVGQGTTFTFTLDFKKTGEKIEREVEQEFRPHNKTSDVRILVAEDVVLNQLLMKTLLEDVGFKLDIAANGKVAIDQVKRNQYDLIFMDLQMPEMNGFSATEYIRNELKLRVPIIALTADVTTADVEKCKSVGMNDYLAKPIDEKLLYGKINKYIRKEISEELNLEGSTTSRDLIIKKYTDLDFLRQLTKNDSEMIAEMIRVYLDETPELIEKMKTALVREDWEMLASAAHSIMPSFATIGMGDVYSEMSKKIQDFARAQAGGKKGENKKQVEISRVKGYISEIEQVCTMACEELQKELAVL
jgi:PAS domain S-box-containing protein